MDQVAAIQEQGADRADIAASGGRRAREIVRRCLWWTALLVPPVLYLVYVAHYSVDVIFWDDWNTVPLVDQVVHGHLPIAAMWAQHNENRMFLANVIFVLFGRFDHFDIRHVIFLSGALFVAAYLLLVATYKAYAGRSLEVVPLLLIGLVWFSLEDFQNALWGFQVAWYLIIFLLMVMLFLMSRAVLSVPLLVAAALCATAASFTSLQGLMLWPVGLLCIGWRIRDRKRFKWTTMSWVVGMLAVSALYFGGFNFSSTGTGGGSVSFAVRHPIGLLKYLLAAMGNIFPTSGVDLRLHEVIGVGMAILVVGVLWFSVLGWRRDTQVPLPAALIIFGLLFDLSAALGRLSFGVDQALSSRYTMANLLVLTGLACYAFGPRRSGIHRRSRSMVGLAWASIAATGMILAAQVGVSANYGVSEATTTKQARLIEARLLVNLHEVPEPRRSNLVTLYAYPSLAVLTPWLAISRSDHLSVFAPGQVARYRSEGPPP